MPGASVLGFCPSAGKCYIQLIDLIQFNSQLQKTLKSNYQKELLGRLLLLYLGGNAGSAFVLTKLWQVNPEFLTKSIFEMYGNDATSLSRILDIAHELKVKTHFFA